MIHDTQPVKTKAIWLVVIALVAFGVYYGGLDSQYFADDLKYIYDAPSSKVFYYFSNSSPGDGFYRPIQLSFLAIVQVVFGLNTIPVHLTQLIVHILLCCLVFVVSITLRFSRLDAALASLFMAVSQANAHAVLSLDTLSQVGGTFFGFLSLYLFYLCCREPTPDLAVKKTQRTGLFVFSVLAFGLSLLFKESSVSFFPVLSAVAVLRFAREGRGRIDVRRKISMVAVYFAVMAAYLVLYASIADKQAAYGSRPYDFAVGVNIVKNIAMFLFAAVSPFSSVKTFIAAKDLDVALLAIIITSTLLFSGLVLIGLWRIRHSHKTVILLTASFSIVSFFPMALMNHVSELHVYNAMPFISILVGAGIGRLLSTGGKRWVVAIVFSGVLASHIVAVWGKSRLIRSNGKSAVELLAQIEPWLAKVPQNGDLVLVNPDTNRDDYSVFVLHGFNPLIRGLMRINQIGARPDVRVTIVSTPELGDAKPDGAVILTLRDGVVEAYGGNEDTN